MPTNRAAWITEPRGSPFVVKEAPYTAAGSSDVVVKNAAVGITPVAYKVQDTDLFKMQYPTILGNELAEEIFEVGDEVKGLAVGQRVMGCVTSFQTS